MSSTLIKKRVNSISFKGSIVALVTPMDPEGNIDRIAYRSLIDWHIQEGTDALVIAGTTGESSTLSSSEHVELIELAVEHAAGRIPIIAGISHSSTNKTISLAKQAELAGAQAGLAVVPYYNKPNQEGIFCHFKALSEKASLPVIIYNVPSRTVVNMSHSTILRLAQLPGIIGIKDATGDIKGGALLVQDLPNEFYVFSGDDQTAAALMLLGAHGNISVTANIVPRLMHKMCYAALEGNLNLVRTYNSDLALLNRALFIETNPIPVKWALSRMGLINLGYRLPLLALAPEHHKMVYRALQNMGLVQAIR